MRPSCIPAEAQPPCNVLTHCTTVNDEFCPMVQCCVEDIRERQWPVSTHATLAGLQGLCQTRAIIPVLVALLLSPAVQQFS